MIILFFVTLFVVKNRDKREREIEVDEVESEG